MINGLEGIPGSGKSYEACVFHVLAALKEGRKVITNLPLNIEVYAAIDPDYRALIELRYVPKDVRGTWDAARIDPETGRGNAIEFFEDGHVESPTPDVRLFGHVWDFITDWKHPTNGRGPLFIIDECHVAFPRGKTPAAVIEWFKLHRHFNNDVLLATQKFRQMEQDIAELMAMVIKVRKADVLGRSDSYIRKVHAGYRGAVIQESVRKYEPHFFKLYTSHTQGNSVLEAGASDVSPLSVKLKKATRAVWAVFAVCVVFAAYTFMKEKPVQVSKVPPGFKSAVVLPDGKTDFKAIQALSKPDTAPPSGTEKKPAAVEGEAVAVPVPVTDPEPYASKGLHVTGKMVMGGRTLYTFAVSAQGVTVTQVTSDDLVAIGYAWKALTECAGYLSWKGSAKAVTCDAPKVQSGSDSRPIVMNNGYSSDGKIVPAGAHPPVAAAPAMSSM